MKSRQVLIGAFLVTLAACTPDTSASTTTSSGGSQPPSPSTTQGSAPTVAPTLPPGTEVLPESLRAEIARLIPRTEELRELTFLEAPAIDVISTEELTQRVVEQVAEEYEDVETDEALYRLLGLVPPDYNLLDNLTMLYGEQVAGYYEGDTKELVVTARNDEFTPLEEATLVHELTHALTDQHHNFNTEFDRLFESDLFDQGSALQAVIEGDASLVETLFAQQLSPAEQQEFLEEAFNIDTTVFDSVPKFIQDSLIFPYDAGVSFVQSIWIEGGFDAIDELYASPPVSTEQVLTPSDLGTDLPAEVEVLDRELEGYERSYGSTWGELGFRLMFDQVLGGAETAAEGWGGDGYDVYFNGSDVVLVLEYFGDAGDDGAQMAEALGDYFQVITGISEPLVDEGPAGGSIYEGETYAFVASLGGRVLLVAASDPATGAIARAWYPEF
ncbi:MAG: DUF6782 family putative metallopeptidase [Acidimicrobiia bacterium]